MRTCFDTTNVAVYGVKLPRFGEHIPSLIRLRQPKRKYEEFRLENKEKNLSD